MNEFFSVWDAAKDVFELSRKVYIDLERGLIKIWQDNTQIIKVEVDFEDDIDTEHLYHLAAERLISWIKQREKQ